MNYSDRKGLFLSTTNFQKKLIISFLRKYMFLRTQKRTFILRFGSETNEQHKNFCLTYPSAFLTILGQGLRRSYKKKWVYNQCSFTKRFGQITLYIFILGTVRAMWAQQKCRVWGKYRNLDFLQYIIWPPPHDGF